MKEVWYNKSKAELSNYLSKKGGEIV